MGFYQDQILPLLINLSMRQKNLVAYRNALSLNPNFALAITFAGAIGSIQDSRWIARVYPRTTC
jgi:hypothetical protein